ncbi:DUF131 domain-containing protein [uncultured Methanolobus sp.]|uniref:TIGR00304 family membrane protein n=1 Tax=uncultured Methanolobus sp. TaxID=218300 RepID=UPI002AAB1D7E|nr:DUF131 domain-containing protein [uncultured Methanolobus sp.]
MFGTYLIVSGMLMIVVGFALICISGVINSKNTEKRDEYFLKANSGSFYSSSGGNEYSPVSDKTEVRGGGLIMLGPIPIIIGSDNKSARTLMILAIVLMLLYFLIFM